MKLNQHHSATIKSPAIAGPGKKTLLAPVIVSMPATKRIAAQAARGNIDNLYAKKKKKGPEEKNPITKRTQTKKIGASFYVENRHSSTKGDLTISPDAY